jgi:colicin import membrane protein
MLANHKLHYVFVSASAHIIIFLILVLGLDFSTPLAVLENTNKNDIISAVVLGDSAKSRILPQQTPAAAAVKKPEPKTSSKPVPPPPQVMKKQAAKNPTVDKEAIALKAAKKQRELFANDLLADIQKQNKKKQQQTQQQKQKKKQQQKQLQAQFAKTLQQQSEQSLRQQLMNEDIALKGMQSRQAQGEVNKYKALILQAISEQWIVPLQANKKLMCELMIRLAPGGMVLDVQVTKSSGDPSLDSSARAAVLKASPLPVPKDLSMFEPFRQFVLKVKPENILE